MVVVDVVGVREGVQVEEGEEGHLVADERVLDGERQLLGVVASCGKSVSARSLRCIVSEKEARTGFEKPCCDADRDGEALPEREEDDALDGQELRRGAASACTWCTRSM